MGKKEEIKARQDKEYEYYKQGITAPKEIKKKLKQDLDMEISVVIIRRDLKTLEEQGRIKIITKEIVISQRRKIVKDLYSNQEITVEKICQETNKRLKEIFGISFSFSITPIESDIQYLKNNNEVAKDTKKKQKEEKELARMELNLKETERLVKEGKTTEQIAEIMGIYKDTISSYRKILREQGRLVTPEVRRKIVKEAYNRGITKREPIKKYVEEKLNITISLRTIEEDMRILREKGEFKTKQETKKELIIELEEEELTQPLRREIVKTMYNNEKSRKEILERLQEIGFDATLKIVDSDIKVLKKQGQITAKSAKERKEEKIQKRREIVKREYNSTEGNKRKTREEIQEVVQQEMKIKISLQIIDQDISYWRKKGEINKKMETKQEKRRAIVKNGVINQQTQKQIQEEIKKKMKKEVSLEKICDDISYLEIEGEIEPEDENLVIRKRREVELYKQDATVEEIQETIKKEFNVKVSLAVIYRDIRPYIKLEKEEKLAIKMSHKELRKVAQKTCEEFYGQANLIMILKRYISSCKIRFQNNVLKAEDLPIIKESVMLMQNYENLAFYLKVAISEEKFEEALDVVNEQIGNEVFTKQEEKAIRSLREKVKVLVQNNRAKQMLEKGYGVKEIVKTTGVLEAKVVEINRKLIEEKQNQPRRLEENDDRDEQELA